MSSASAFLLSSTFLPASLLQSSPQHFLHPQEASLPPLSFSMLVLKVNPLLEPPSWVARKKTLTPPFALPLHRPKPEAFHHLQQSPHPTSPSFHQSPYLPLATCRSRPKGISSLHHPRPDPTSMGHKCQQLNNALLDHHVFYAAFVSLLTSGKPRNRAETAHVHCQRGQSTTTSSVELLFLLLPLSKALQLHASSQEPTSRAYWNPVLDLVLCSSHHVLVGLVVETQGLFRMLLAFSLHLQNLLGKTSLLPSGSSA